MLDKLDLIIELEELLESSSSYIFNDHCSYPAELIIFPYTDAKEKSQVFKQYLTTLAIFLSER